MIFRKRIVSALATGAILLYAFAPTAFATTIDITGNGTNSENNAKIESEQSTTVVQNNNADIQNSIKSEAKTGSNYANDNTGGDVTVLTGTANSDVTISNLANKNLANIPNCGGCNVNGDITISGNGTDSENKVNLENENKTSVFQDNKAEIKNRISSEADTGHNDANRNTGGNVTIGTGNATSTVDITNKANLNAAQIGSGSGTGTLSATITGNGSDSENEIKLENERKNTIVQANDAYFKNKVKSEAETGDNNANDNTNGDILVVTGDAHSTVNVDNLANFNWVDADCCLVDLTAKIAGNGSDSENEIKAELENELSIFQGDKENHDNLATLKNKIWAQADTGRIDADRNTDPSGNDGVAVSTGNATDNVQVSNSSNLNQVGPSTGTEITLPGGLSINLLFDLNALLGLLH